ncbi:MAG: glycosyltransferase [Nitrosomonas sp.]
MKKIKILHALVRVGSGGVEQTRLSLVKHLDRNIFEQCLVCSDYFGGLPGELEDAGCPVHEVGVLKHPFDPNPYSKVLKVIRTFKPDIIHGAVFEGVSFAAVSGRLGGVPIILGEETSDPQDRRWTGHLLFRILAGMTHHMVAVSPAVRTYLIGKIHLPVNKVTLINNGVAEAPSTNPSEVEELRHTLGLTDHDFVIGTVGRLYDNHKRVSDLIRALGIMHLSHFHAHLLIVGGGADEEMLRQLAAGLGIAQHVHFVGYQANPRPYYTLMDVFALASSWEAFGLVLVEAMFANLPVVGTRVGGIPTVVREGETGLLVEPRQPQALADAFLTLFRSPGLRHEMGRKGRIKALAEFGEERYVREVGELYQKLAIQYLPA